MLRLRTSMKWTAVALAAAALTAPPAYAMHGPGEGVAPPRAQSHMLDNSSATQVERLGPKYLLGPRNPQIHSITATTRAMLVDEFGPKYLLSYELKAAQS